MLLKQIREACEARPFRRFTLCLANGQRVEVTHPGDVFIPRGPTRDFIVVTPDGLFRFVDALLVSTLEFRVRRRGPRRGGNGTNGRPPKGGG